MNGDKLFGKKKILVFKTDKNSLVYSIQLL